jgi:DNA repair exonuclease SbcCD nuclease subunit
MRQTAKDVNGRHHDDSGDSDSDGDCRRGDDDPLMVPPMIGILGDTHFGARSDSPAIQANMAKFYEKVFFPTLDQSGITTLVHLGDFTDRRKYGNYATSRFIYETYRRPLAERRISQVILVGNHDCYYRHTNDVNSVEEFYRGCPEVEIIKHPIETMIGGIEWLCLPWICDENRERSVQLIAESRASHVLGHLQLTGFQMHKGLPAETGMDPQAFDRFKLVLSGHFHHQSHAGAVHYLGAPYPMVWSDYADARGFHLFEPTTDALTFIENPYTLFNRILYNDTDQPFAYLQQWLAAIMHADSPYRDAYTKIIVQTKTHPAWFDKIMDALYRVNALDVTVLDDIIVNDDDTETRTAATNLSVDTLTVIDEYVDSLNMSSDPTPIKTYLRTLYQRAQDTTRSARL